MPGFGPVLAAEFLGATGGDLTIFETADRFAGVAGLAPVPRDSGRITGNHHRPRRYDRRLLRVFYLSGLSALKSCPPPGPTTTENAPKVRPTSRPCSPSPDAASTSSGPCSATAPPTLRSPRRQPAWLPEPPRAPQTLRGRSDACCASSQTAAGGFCLRRRCDVRVQLTQRGSAGAAHFQATSTSPPRSASGTRFLSHVWSSLQGNTAISSRPPENGGELAPP